MHASKPVRPSASAKQKRDSLTAIGAALVAASTAQAASAGEHHHARKMSIPQRQQPRYLGSAGCADSVPGEAEGHRQKANQARRHH